MKQEQKAEGLPDRSEKPGEAMCRARAVLAAYSRANAAEEAKAGSPRY